MMHLFCLNLGYYIRNLCVNFISVLSCLLILAANDFYLYIFVLNYKAFHFTSLAASSKTSENQKKLVLNILYKDSCICLFPFCVSLIYGVLVHSILPNYLFYGFNAFIIIPYSQFFNNFHFYVSFI
jgi:hypothetical protein